MNFGAPGWLWGVAGTLVLALVLVWRSLDARGRSGARVRWPRISRVTAAPSGVRPAAPAGRPRPPWFLLLAAALLFCAVAKPRWGRIDEEVVEQAREVMIALDLSRSMLVADVPPSRLERAKLLTKTLLDALQGERVGLIVFAGTAFVQVPLSPDYQILHEFLPELNPAYMPQGGTDYAGMLRAALDGFGRDTTTDRFLIVLSDGESQTEAWRDHLPELRERGVQILTLGLGTPDGGFIPDGNGGYVKDERGAVVLSRLETRTLQSLAQETRGTYRNASEWVDLPALLEATIARARQGQFSGRREERFIDRFQWFLAPALIFGLLGLWRDIPVRPRPQTVRRTAPAATPQIAAAAARSLTPAATLVALTWLVMTAASTTCDAAETAPDSTPEARVRETVARLAATPNPTARDWRELADRTLVYGSGARMQQQPLEPGAIRDALLAVDRGEAANPALADWKKLRADLNALLEQPPQNQSPDSPPPEQQEQDEQEKKQEEQSDPSESNDNSNNQSNESEEPPPGEQGEPPPQQPEGSGSDQAPEDAPPPSTPPAPSAGGQSKEGELGDMEGPAAPPPAAPPPPPAEQSKTHKIGGKPAEDQPPPMDAATAILQQRMREAAENDSPARLYQLIQGEQKEAAPRGRDW